MIIYVAICVWRYGLLKASESDLRRIQRVILVVAHQKISLCDNQIEEDHRDSLVKVIDANLVQIENTGADQSSYLRFVHRSLRRCRRAEISQQKILRISAIHGWLIMTIILILIGATRFSSPNFIHRELLVHFTAAGAAQNILLWFFMKIRPKGPFSSVDATQVFAKNLEAAMHLCIGTPSNLDLLHNLEEREISLGVSLATEKFETVANHDVSYWMQSHMRRTQWQSLGPLFEIIGLACGASTLITLLQN